MDPRVQKLADVLVNYSLKVQPGEWVIIRGEVEALPLIQESLRYTLRAGGRPSVLIGDEYLQEILLKEGNLDQLAWISPFERQLFEDSDAFLRIRGSANTRALSGVDPARQAHWEKARQGVYQAYRQRSAEGKLKWVTTNFPCHALAQEADMSLAEYEDFVFQATFTDQPDPVARWQQVHDRQEELIAWLKGREQVEVRGPNVDLRLSIKGRRFINSSGERNMPSGEIFTSPVEDSAEGWIQFTYPAVRLGREVDGVSFRFEKGRVVEARARKNEAYLLELLDGEELARYLGEFAIGTNYGIQRFTKSILFDEKIGGTIHLAIGAGFVEAGGDNRASIHWDFICDMRQDSEIRVDGELFYKNGQFVV